MEFPVFDKGLQNGKGDRIDPIKKKCQMLIFEGWFNGFQTLDLSQNILETLSPEKKDLLVDCNQKLFDYKHLWDHFQELIVLKPENYRYSFQWRAQAEKGIKGGMDEKEIERFVGYFMNCLPPEIYYQSILNDRERFRNRLILQLGKTHDLTDFF